MLVAGIARGERFHHRRRYILQIRQLAAVEFAVNPRLHLACDEGRDGREHHVVARRTRHQLRLEDLVGIIDVVIDLDPGLRGEPREGVLGDVVGPVVDIQDLFLVGEGRAGTRHHRGEEPCREDFSAHRENAFGKPLSAPRHRGGRFGIWRDISYRSAPLSTGYGAGVQKFSARVGPDVGSVGARFWSRAIRWGSTSPIGPSLSRLSAGSPGQQDLRSDPP